MSLLTEKRPMAKMGRPPRPGKQPTRMLRASVDLAEMVTWVCRAEGLESAELLDLLLRPQIVAKYLENYSLIVSMKQKRDQAAERIGKIPSRPLPQIPTLDEVTGEIVSTNELAERQKRRAEQGGESAPSPKKRPKP